MSDPARSPGGGALLRASGLRMRYGERTVFSDVDLAFRAGEMIGLIGPNGSGKTTLLRLLMGLITPAMGEVCIDGVPLARYRRRRLARLMTLVPQDTGFDFALSVEAIVAMGRNPHLGRFEVPGASDLALIAEAMALTGVAALAGRTIDTLSGGERQRVLIARAIAQQTPIVLLDEVTANLDLCHQLEVLDLARAMAARGCLVIAAIHDLGMASRWCDRLVLLADGALQADGPPRAVLTRAILRRFFAVDALIGEAPSGAGLAVTALASTGSGPSPPAPGRPGILGHTSD